MESQYQDQQLKQFQENLEALFKKYDKDKSNVLDNASEISTFFTDCYSYAQPLVMQFSAVIASQKANVDPKSKVIFEALIKEDVRTFFKECMVQFDQNKDGKIVREEFYAAVRFFVGAVLKLKYSAGAE